MPTLFYKHINHLFTSVGDINNDFLTQIVPPGDLKFTASVIVPTGYLLCDGSAVPRDDYADLFAAIGTAYGVGDGSTTFNVPDYRGRFPIGAGQTQGLLDSLGAPITGTSYARGAKGGEQVHELTLPETPEHQHYLFTDESTAAGSPVSANRGVMRRYEAGSEPSYYMREGGGTDDDPTIADLGLSSPTGGAGADGLANAHATIPPYSVCLVYIKW